MRSILLRIATFVALFVLLAFAVFVVNQTASVVRLAAEISPDFGFAVLVVLLVLYGALLVTPLVLWLRLPPPLAPPATDEGPAFDRHLDALRRRLRAHPTAGKAPLGSREEIEAALAALDTEGEEIVRSAAGGVFLATAVSQSGRLDALLVLAAQSRLVWRLAQHYYQRPGLRDMLYLYANVAATAFLAAEIEDIDVAAEIQPILASTLGSSAIGGVAQNVPFLGAASGLVVNSTFVGATNAFLTLRVGVITQRYCGALVVEPRRSLRRAGVVRAGALLGTIVADGVKTLAASASKASVSGVKGVSGSLGRKTRSTGGKILGLFRRGDGEETLDVEAGADEDLVAATPPEGETE